MSRCCIQSACYCVCCVCRAEFACKNAQRDRLVNATDSHADDCMQDIAEVLTASPVSGPSLAKFAAALFLSGATLGPLLDAIHGTVELNHYDVFPINIAGLHSSALVPPLLGSFYAVAGGMIVAMDWIATSDAQIKIPGSGFLAGILRADSNLDKTEETCDERTSLPAVALCTGALAYLLELSANLYGNDVPYYQIHATLAAAAFANWWIFDGTRQGAVLGAICGVGAPLSELVIMQLFGLWHYPRPDVFGAQGLPSWVAWCYAFYTPALSNLARSYWQRVKSDA